MRLTEAEAAASHDAWITVAAGVAMGLTALIAAAPAPAGLFLGWALLGWALLTLAVVDVKVYRLPDAVTLPLAAAGLAAAALGLTGEGRSSLPDHVIGAAAGYLGFAAVGAVYRRARGREGLGLGDAKLAAAGGAWLGWAALPAMVLAACGLAFLWVAARVARSGSAALRSPLPFGPPLAAAIWVLWLLRGHGA